MADRINERAEWIFYNGTRIIFLDYRGLRDKEYVDEIKRTERDLLDIGKKEGKRSLLLLVDINDTVISPDVVTAFKNVASVVEPYSLATAVLGIYGVRKMLLDIVRKFSNMIIRGFDTEQEAKGWLVEQAG